MVFFAHGAQKMLGWFKGPGLKNSIRTLNEHMHIPSALGFLAIAAEFFGGVGLIVGLLGRIAAVTVAVIMVVAIVPFANSNHIGVMVYSPMYSGLLSGAMTRERITHLAKDDWRKRDPSFQEPLLSRNLRLVQTMRSIGNRYNASPGEVAIAWTLRNPAVTVAFATPNKCAELRVPLGSVSTRRKPTRSKTP